MRVHGIRGWRWLAAGLLSLSGGVVQAQLQSLLAPQTLQVGCDWILAYDSTIPDRGNYAFPETHARYWVAVISDTVPAGSRLKIEGRYPDARYSALHVHDGNLFVHDALSDNEFAPDPGSVNRNLDRTRRDIDLPTGGSYTGYVNIGQSKPPIRTANTLYRPAPALFDSKVKKRTALAYRTYLAEGDNTGGVDLPKLTLLTPQGARALSPAVDKPTCDAIQAQFAVAAVSLPVSLLQPLIPEAIPVFKKFDGALLNATGLGVGFNPHNGFLAAKTDLAYGDMVLVRGQLPTYTTQDQPDPTPQLRYWSLCQSGAASTKVVACVADQSTPLDEHGYYNVVLSKHTARPATLPTSFAWLPMGTEKQGAMTVRELLAHPQFAKSIEKASTRNTALDRDTYMPVATYCSQAVFDSARTQQLSAEATFIACQAARGLLPGL
ncbi:MAG: hypothetical protein ACT4PG_01045 [Panacagrimonas sp.]